MLYVTLHKKFLFIQIFKFQKILFNWVLFIRITYINIAILLITECSTVQYFIKSVILSVKITSQIELFFN